MGDSSPVVLMEGLRGTIFHHMKWLSLSLALALRALVNPRLARDLITVAWRFRRRDWLTHAPFLPVPSKEYVAWRMYTAFGDHDAVPSMRDVIRYARWARRGV
ncbi:MAG TPA: hypothetical protein VGQ30_05590 [Gemmatimonadaceae bacterium]|jgi:hypothetical protein|nr:hypothetical protein [Gemmatimonadaceae bacterium]